MSRLYMTASSDAARNGKTMSGHKWINIELGYDPSSSHTVNVRMNVPTDTNLATLWVDGKKIWEQKHP